LTTPTWRFSSATDAQIDSDGTEEQVDIIARVSGGTGTVYVAGIFVSTQEL
jgi:hypothetical protein